MIDNDPRKSIRSKARGMGVSDFNWQIINEDMLYEKGLISITGHKGKEEIPLSKPFQQTQASPLTEYALHILRREKFLQGSDGEQAEQPLASLCSNKMY